MYSTYQVFGEVQICDVIHPSLFAICNTILVMLNIVEPTKDHTHDHM